jgi:hypothetical protein
VDSDLSLAHNGSAGFATGAPEASIASIRRFENALVVAIYVLLVAASLLPICLVRYPTSVDYLNHLGRLFVLTAPSNDPVHVFYQPDWHFIPNLGLDLLVLGLERLMPLETAMKTALVIIFVSLPSAFFYLYTAIHRRIAPSLLVSTLCLSNLSLLAGFLSFYLGLAAGLAAIGLWFRLGETATVRNLLILNVVSAAILVIHAAALLVFGITIVTICTLRSPWHPAMLIRRAIIVSCGFLAPFLLLVLTRHTTAGVPSLPYLNVDFLQKPILFLNAVFAAVPLATAIGASALILSLFILMRVGRAHLDRRLVPALVVWAVIVIALPTEIDRWPSVSWWAAVDTRLVLFPILLLLASLQPAPARIQWIAAGLATVAVCARVVITLPAALNFDTAVAEFRALGTTVEPGAKLLIAEGPVKPGTCNKPRQWLPLYHHVPVLLVLDRRAFVPGLFSAPGPVPIRVTDRYRAISDPAAPVAPWPVLAIADTEQGRSRISEMLSSPRQPYFFGWREAFDYLIVITVNCVSEIPPDRQLVPVARSKAFLLYRISHAP